MNDITRAFHEVCKESVKAQAHYLCLVAKIPFYGGPEEGGWWGADHILVAYKEYPSEESARLAVQELAGQLTKEARDGEGEYCLRTMEWLEERGLDADYLPELDGSEEYYVSIEEELPQNYYGERQYS